MGPVSWPARGVFAVGPGRWRPPVRLLVQRGTRLPEGADLGSMRAPAQAREHPLIVVGSAHEGTP
jgi:hypothetical protein